MANDTGLDKYAALLHAPWEACKEPNEIVGKWAEDGNEYIIQVPPQLRNMLVDLQNVLADRYYLLRNLRSQVARVEAEAQALLGAQL